MEVTGPQPGGHVRNHARSMLLCLSRTNFCWFADKTGTGRFCRAAYGGYGQKTSALWAWFAKRQYGAWFCVSKTRAQAWDSGRERRENRRCTPGGYPMIGTTDTQIGHSVSVTVGASEECDRVRSVLEMRGVNGTLLRDRTG